MKKTILMLTQEYPPFRGGIATYAEQVARAAAELGHSVTVLAPSFGASESADAIEQAGKRLSVDRYRGGHYHARDLPAHLARIAMRICRGRFDLIHAVDFPNALAMHLLRPFLRKRNVCTVHGTDVLGFLSSRHVRLLRAQGVFDGASHVYANSEYTKRELCARRPRVCPKTTATGLGVDRFWLQSCESEHDVRGSLGADPKASIVLTVGRIDPRKGHDIGVEVVARLNKDGIDAVYVVAGKGNDAGFADLVRDRAEQLGVSLYMTGAVSGEELRELYQSADVFLLPAVQRNDTIEGFGLVLLEAAAQGLPSVTTAVGGIPEAVADGASGVVCKAGDVESMASASKRIIAEPSYRASLSRGAKKLAQERTWTRVAESIYGAA